MDKTRKYITSICSVCKEEYIQQVRVYVKAKWKDRCPKHRKYINKCTSCGKEIYRASTMCKSCAQKGPINLCKICGVVISARSVICLSCHNKLQDKGLSTERTKFQNSKEWKEVRDQCFTRDNHTCQWCTTRGGKLEAHHIKSWKDNLEVRLCLDNLMTLCVDCHRRLHRRW